MKISTFNSVLCLVTLALLLGCGSGGMEAHVSGRVTLDGKPVGPGTVVFTPTGDANPATGTIKLDGSYTLKSNRTEGLPTGPYKISVTVFDQPPVPAGERSTVPAKLITPEKYADPSTSGMEYTVVSGNNEHDIELKSP